MGLLIEGTPLKWEDMKQYRAYIKEHGTKQFINIWRLFKDRSQDEFLWGDEVETLIVHMDKKTNFASISLRANEILEELHQLQQKSLEKTPDTPLNVTFHPEYGNFMVETTPGFPYGGFTRDLCLVEPNMRLRRCLISSKLRPDELVVTMSNFPLLGVIDPSSGYHFSTPAYPAGGEVCKSEYIHDKVMSPHPRFATLSGNIRRRRGKRVNIKHPLFIDSKTTKDSAGNGPCTDERESLRPHCDEIHMDAMVFGMGCCCLQVTFQTRSIDEARNLYDQLGAISPIFLALTANTPFHRGRIANTDVRWDTISAAVDDRTDEECGLPPLTDQDRLEQGIVLPEPISPTNDEFVSAGLSDEAKSTISDVKTSGANESTGLAAVAGSCSHSCDGDLDTENGADINASVGIAVSNPYGPLAKSRYSSIDCYIGQDSHYSPKYNDLPFKYDNAVYDQLVTAGVDSLLAKHTASLFVRDPLVVFEGKVEVDDEATTEHFESIQSTNWRSVRFKPPPLGNTIGWRVEFRTMEVQLTDFENAAFTVFIALLTRAISFFHLNFYIPLSEVEANFKTAHEENAAQNAKFHMRKVVKRCVRSKSAKKLPANKHTPASETMPVTVSQAQASVANDKKPVLSSADLALFRNNSMPFAWEANQSSAYENKPLPVQCSAIEGADGLISNTLNSNGSNGNGNCSEHVETATLEEEEVDTIASPSTSHDCSELMTMKEIFCGKAPSYPGLIPLVRAYLDVIKCDVHTRLVIDKYISLIEKRATGELLTGAQFLRKFARSHPTYQFDSKLTPEMVYELAILSDMAAKDKIALPELIGVLNYETKDIFACISKHDPEFSTFVGHTSGYSSFLREDGTGKDVAKEESTMTTSTTTTTATTTTTSNVTGDCGKRPSCVPSHIPFVYSEKHDVMAGIMASDTKSTSSPCNLFLKTSSDVVDKPVISSSQPLANTSHNEILSPRSARLRGGSVSSENSPCANAEAAKAALAKYLPDHNLEKQLCDDHADADEE